MSAAQFDEFDRRMRRITQRHSKLSHGYTAKVTGDGLMVAKPKRKTPRATLRGVAIVVLVLMVFKGFLHARLGEDAYAQRVDALSNGTVFEQVGAVMMTADPITVLLSRQISKLY